LRLTCSSLSLYPLSPVQAVRTIAELGFPALDLVGIPSFPIPHVDVARRDPAELRRLSDAVERAGVEVASVVTVASDGLDRWDAEEIDARVGWAVRASEAVGAARLVLDAGNPVPGERVDRAQALARWRTMFHAAFAKTSAAGVALALEAPHTGTLAERYDELDELLMVLGLPDVGIDYDTSHVFRSGTSVEAGLAFVGDRLVKVALRDVDASGEFCRPGAGLIDFAQLLALLEARGYAGDLVIELETPGVEAPEDQRREIELTREYVEGLLAPPP
jgi:sugar phosphate isomerase/epimerase